MILFDLLDTILIFILRLTPSIIAIISMIIAYYYYKKLNKEKFEQKTTNDKIKILYHNNPQLFNKTLINKYIKNTKKEYPNYFCNRDCKKINNKCKFRLNEKVTMDCPNILCENKNICKKTIVENFDNSNYYCFDGEKCIAKKYLEPSKTSCGSPSISQYPNKIYTSEDECNKENTFYKNLDKQSCIRLPHGYGWLEGTGCIKGSPVGPNEITLDYSHYADSKIKYTASNPDAFILPKHNFHYTNLI